MGTVMDKVELEEIVSNGADTAKGMMKKIRRSGRRALDATNDTVQERPLMSLIVMFVLGLMLGTLLDYKLRR